MLLPHASYFNNVSLNSIKWLVTNQVILVQFLSRTKNVLFNITPRKFWGLFASQSNSIQCYFQGDNMMGTHITKSYTAWSSTPIPLHGLSHDAYQHYPISSYCRTTGEQSIWKDFEGNAHDLIKILSQYLIAGAKVTHKKLKIASVLAKIQMQYIPNISLQCYSKQQFGWSLNLAKKRQKLTLLKRGDRK